MQNKMTFILIMTHTCRDASWELEANAYSELLEVYKRCDALTCLHDNGRTHSAKTGYDLCQEMFQ